jgi:Tfp pilus assembly protein PilN
VKAVNLIPADAQRGRGVQLGSLPSGPGAIVLGILAVALALVTVYVLTANSISERKVTLATDQAQLTTVKAEAAELSQYSDFAQLAQARIQTIREIATSRFDWHASLADLSKVVPADTSLQSLVGTVSPDTGVGGASSAGSGAGSLRSAIDAPAFELSGCTKTQDDVARLMSRLRLMNGVTRVTLADSTKSAGAQAGASVASGSAAGATASQGCGANTPSFDLVVFFQPLPGATPTATAGTATTVGTTSTTSTTAAAATPAGTSTTSQPLTTTSTTSTVSSGSGGASSGGAR